MEFYLEHTLGLYSLVPTILVDTIPDKGKMEISFYWLHYRYRFAIL